jgi:hypothetical protein
MQGLFQARIGRYTSTLQLKRLMRTETLSPLRRFTYRSTASTTSIPA